MRPTASKLLHSIRGKLATADTPLKALPFSPSQFFNSPCYTNGQNMATSTPVKRGKVRTAPKHPIPGERVAGQREQARGPQTRGLTDFSLFQTGFEGALTTPPPNHHDLGDSNKLSALKNKHLSGAGVTRTPTPFKRALAELRKQTVDSSGSGHLVDDITEIIDKENGRSAKNGADSLYETDASGNLTAIKAEDEGEGKKDGRKVRKSLLNSAWEMSDLSYLAETPVSLLCGQWVVDMRIICAFSG